MERNHKISRYSKRSKINTSTLHNKVFGPKSKSTTKREQDLLNKDANNLFITDMNQNLVVKEGDNKQNKKEGQDENIGYEENNNDGEDEGFDFPSDIGTPYRNGRENGPQIIIQRENSELEGSEIENSKRENEETQRNEFTGNEFEGDYKSNIKKEEKKIDVNDHKDRFSNNSSSQSENFQLNTEYGENIQLKTRFQSKGILS